jgi:hypothetical protein
MNRSSVTADQAIRRIKRGDGDAESRPSGLRGGGCGHGKVSGYDYNGRRRVASASASTTTMEEAQTAD